MTQYYVQRTHDMHNLYIKLHKRMHIESIFFERNANIGERESVNDQNMFIIARVYNVYLAAAQAAAATAGENKNKM